MAKATLEDRAKQYEETRTRLKFALEACPKDNPVADAIRDAIAEAGKAVEHCRRKARDADEEDD